VENKIKHIGLGICMASLLMAFAMKTKREVVLTDKAPKPIGPYSQAIKTEEALFVSGQIALTTEGKLDTSSVENECRRVMENIKAVVEAAGYQMSDVVKSTIYTTNLSYFQKINEVYGRYFPKEPPARETVQVSALPKGARVEISVMAQQ
jgi:2-iminobutanoate/2-iminopropanoate deaminase